MSGSLTTGHAVEVVWDQFESTLRALYLELNLTLEEVRTEMARTYQFNASKAQYERQFNKWNFRKNWTAKEWKILAHKIMQRGREHKDSEVLVNGKPINPKKLRKETLRYRSRSGGTEIRFPAPLPPTPERFIIRTPSPKFTTSTSLTSASAPLWDVPPSINTSLIYCLPFYQVSFVLNQVNSFPRMPGLVRSTLGLLPQDIHFTMLDELKASIGEIFFGFFKQKVEALMPENTFHDNAAISQDQASSIVDPLKLALYLFSNNFLGNTSGVSDKIYDWVKHCSDTGLMQYLLSIHSPTADALRGNLFRLAIDAQDTLTVKKMMDLGVDPNEQVCFHWLDGHTTPLQQACRLRSLELVRVLIDGGARFNLSAREAQLALVNLFYNPLDNGHPMRIVNTELVRILLRAGAIVNPGFGKSPLAAAVELGHVEAVNLLISAGADVNFTSNGSGLTPLICAVKCKNYIPKRDVISMARALLIAGADPQAKFRNESGNGFETVLQCAIRKQSIELIQLLLSKGAQVTEPAFVKAAKYCDIKTTKLLLRFGAEITEEVIGSAVKNDDSKLLFFLFEAAEEKTKIRGENIAFIKALEHGKIDLFDRLGTEGAQLGRNFKPDIAIYEAIKREDLHVLHLLLNEESRFRANCFEDMGRGLVTAIKAGRNDIIELLLTSGADFPRDDFTGCELLLEAIRLKNPHLVRKLLAAGIPMNRAENHYQTTSVLPDVIDWGYYPLIQEMIDAGADVNASQIFGSKTSLFVAVENKNSAVIELLFDAGADINALWPAIHGNSALEAACRNNDLDMVRNFLDLGAEPDEWSLVAAISGSVELVQTLLAARLNGLQTIFERLRMSRSATCYQVGEGCND